MMFVVLFFSMTTPLRIVGFAGSLRTQSLNKALLRAAAALAPADMTVTILDIGNLPLFNQDLELALPESVRAFKDAVQSADAILIATPEYNYSIPGVLKNAIDWLSRPSGSNSFNDKPVAIMGTSPGMLGSSRAQYHLRQCFVSLNAHVLNQPEIIVSQGAEKFSADGTLTDVKTKEKLVQMLTALVAWTHRLAQK